MAIKCVIFDVGGVFVTDKIEAAMTAANRKLHKRIFERRSTIRNKLLCGKIREKEYYPFLAKQSGIPASELRKTFDSEYKQFDRIDFAVARIARKINKTGLRTAILSNATPEQKKINSKRGIYKICNCSIISCDVGCMKPDKRIFMIALKKVKLPANECIFIDDRKENLVVPKKMGMKTIHFKNAKNLALALKKLKINI